jgi:hypothetical protein
MLTNSHKRKIKELWVRACKAQDRESMLQAWELFQALSEKKDKAFEAELGSIRKFYLNKKVEDAISKCRDIFKNTIMGTLTEFFADKAGLEFWYATSPYTLAKGESPSKYTPITAPKSFFEETHKSDYAPAIQSAGLADIKERLYKDFCLDVIPFLDGEKR